MTFRRLFWLFVVTALPSSASAHHLDNFDELIRAEARLPADWFHCRTAKDCDLVSVPCQSDLAVNSDHATEAREKLVDHIPFCLGSSLHDTEAECVARQCRTKASQPKP
jgi:hypothetical protein